jgi:hypothetical protein
VVRRSGTFSIGDWVGGSANVAAAQPLDSHPGDALPVVGTSFNAVYGLFCSGPGLETIVSKHERIGRKLSSDQVAADMDAQLDAQLAMDP